MSSRAEVAQDILDENHRINTRRGLPDLFDMPGIGKRKSERIALCAGGPSLAASLGSLHGATIMACGSAHKFFVDHGVKERFVTVCDACLTMKKYHPAPVDGVTYLLATTCDPALFDNLAGADIYTWNNLGAVTGGVDSGGKWIGGGGTVTTRSLSIAIALGYDGIDVYGFDCSFVGGAQHAYITSDPESSEILTARPEGSDRSFLTTPQYFLEAQYFREMYNNFGHMFDIRVHGDGLVAEMMKLKTEKTS